MVVWALRRRRIECVCDRLASALLLQVHAWLAVRELQHVRMYLSRVREFLLFLAYGNFFHSAKFERANWRMRVGVCRAR
jgi:hypothetical protein